MGSMKDLLGDTLERDFSAPYQPHSAPSREAAKSIASRLPALQQRVLDCFKSHPDGMTDEQLIDALDMSDSTVRPRRIELVEAGLLIKTERYALTRSGRRASLWAIK